ncbi:MAG TPA: DUF1501 domain-containing protein [Dongiaceae bacterium]|nr:DUF1501 domain-containing protein [Dongiaceae bacterium]
MRPTGSDEVSPRLVVINLRGGLDGLAAVPPHGDPAYRAARGGLALPMTGPRRIIDLDGRFGLHPALGPLHAFFARGEMLVMPASCFSQQDAPLESRSPAGPNEGPLHAVGQDRIAAVVRRSVRSLAATYAERDGPLWQSLGADSARRSAQLDLVADLSHNNPEIGRSLTALGWPRDLRAAFAAEARFFSRRAAEIGHRLAAGDAPAMTVLESGGWDTHSDQGAADGRLAIALAGLGDGIAALAAASGRAWRNTAVLVLTEFGRAVRMNAMEGTDHGAASVALLLGGDVAGGRVLGSWPGLAPDRLLQGGGLQPTMDLAGVIPALLAPHMRQAFAAEQISFPNAAGSQPALRLFRG